MISAISLAAAVILGQGTAAAPQPAAAPALSIKRIKTLDGFRAVAIAASPVGTQFAASGETGEVQIIDSARKLPTVTLLGHAQPAYGLAFSPDGKQILTGDEQAKIMLWDVKSGKLIREFPRARGHQRGIQSLAYSPDGKQFVSVGRDDVICVWNVAGGNPVAKVTGEPANFYGAYMMKNGAVYTGTQVEGWRVLAPKTLNIVTKVSVPGGQGAQNFAINRAQTMGVACGRNGVVSVYNLANRKRLASLMGHQDFVTAADFTPSGKFVATTSIDGTLRIWDVKAFKEVTVVDHRSYVGSPVAFSGDGRYMMSTNEFDKVEIHGVTPPQPAVTPKPTKKK